MTRTESEIRAEIERLRNNGWEHNENRIAALEWVLSSPSPVAGEDEIVEAGAREIYNHWRFQAQVKWVDGGNSLKQDEARDYARASYVVARPMISRAARAEADAEIAAADARGRIAGLMEARMMLLGRTDFLAYRAIAARIAELTADSMETTR